MISTPKQASTVVLINEDYEVFLTKRPKSMRFLGGYYVFPGGGMDKVDREIDPTLLRGKIREESLDIGHYIAAARELFEEVGILLAETKDGKLVNLENQVRDRLRIKLLQDQLNFEQLLIQHKLCLNTKHLHYFGNLITPEQMDIRFDTKFFLAKLPAKQSPKINKREVANACWISAEEGLSRYKNRQLLLAPPTIAVLESIIQLKQGGSLTIQHDRVEYLTKKFLRSKNEYLRI